MRPSTSDLPSDYLDDSHVPPAPGRSEERRALRLAFDNARYTDGKLPCQLLALCFNTPKLSFCVYAGNVPWVVEKRQLRNLMSSGWFVWVDRPQLQEIPSEILKSLSVRAVKSINDYAPLFQDIPLSPKKYPFMEEYHPHMRMVGRIRTHHPSGTVAGGINLQSYIERVDESGEVHPPRSEVDEALFIEREQQSWDAIQTARKRSDGAQ